MGKRKRRKKAPRIPVWAVVGVALVSVFLLVVAALEALGSSLLAEVGDALGLRGGVSRMEAFRAAPPSAHNDLLYLSFLDSLARDGRALPRLSAAASAGTLPRQLVTAAGIPAAIQKSWGLRPADEAEYEPRDELFRELHRRGHIILPLEGASLWDHVRDREVQPGFVIFGCTQATRPRGIDFCGVFSIVNWLQPEHSAVIYRDPRTGKLRHTSVEEMPTIAYYGCGRLGDDLGATYLKYFRLADHRGQTPLYRR